MRDIEGIHGNHVLGSLMESGCEHLHRHLEPVPLAKGKVLWESGAALRHVYFPTTSIVSMLYVMADGSVDEVASVGNEGFIGVQLFLGCETLPSRALVRSAGKGFRLEARLLRQEFDRSPAIQHLFLRYTQSLLVQVSQTVACNRHHSVHQRLCRWLLACADRLSAAELPATQESIGVLLGVRRESVTKELGELRAAGVISSRRGCISVLDRPNLEARACACYRGIRNELNHLLTGHASAAIQDSLTEHLRLGNTLTAARSRFDPVTAYPASRSAHARRKEEAPGLRYQGITA